MAEGDDNILDLPDGHEEFFDWSCNQCGENGRVSEAVAFCEDCREGYCTPCLKIHERFPAMKAHNVLNATQKDDWGEGTSGPGCLSHRGQKVCLFCKTHDAVCCRLCKAVNHRACKDVRHISEIATGIKSSKQLRNTQADVSNEISAVSTLVERRENAMQYLNRLHKDVESQIENEVEEVKTILNGIKEKALSEICTLRNAVEHEMKTDLESCKGVQRELEIFQRELNNTTETSETDIFVTMKLYDKKRSESHDLARDLSKSLDIKASRISSDQALHTVKKIRAVAERERRLYKPHQEYECIIRSPEDKERIFVAGMYQLPNGSFLLSDSLNMKLKVFDINYKMVDICPVPGHPSQISGTDKPSSEEVVVSLIEGTLLFFSVKHRVKLTKTKEMSHKCNGILFHDGKFYITDGSCRVYIYTSNFELLKTIKKDQNGTKVFTHPQDISLNMCGKKEIFVANNEGGALAIDLGGNVLYRMKLSADRDSCYTLESDGSGNLIAQHGTTIVQYCEKGNTILGIVTRQALGFFIDIPKQTIFVLKERDGHSYAQTYKQT